MADDLKAILEQQNSEYKDAYGFSDDFKYDFKTAKGLSEKIVKEISTIKNEPEAIRRAKSGLDAGPREKLTELVAEVTSAIREELAGTKELANMEKTLERWAKIVRGL